MIDINNLKMYCMILIKLNKMKQLEQFMVVIN